MIKAASAAKLKQWLEAGEATLVDVREPDEYTRSHIAGSVSLPLATVTADALPPFEGKKLVMQCQMGSRSLTACKKLAKENPTLDVYNLEGGIFSWKKAGYETITVPANGAAKTASPLAPGNG